MQENAKKLHSLLSNGSKNIIITTHRSPDGDAMGSSLAVYNLLIQLNHSVNIVVPNNYPKFLKWLPSDDKVIIYEDNKNCSDDLVNKADIIFLLDFGNIYRIQPFSDTIKASNANKVLIDHHEDPDNDIADIVFSYPNACATAEVVYEIIDAMNFNNYINKQIAECLYVGIMTDTGSFKYPSTTSRTHQIISKLIDAGAENSKIHDFIYDSLSSDRMKLLGYCLNEKLILIEENNSAIISLNNIELKKFNFKKGDTEGIVNYALAIENIFFAVFIVEKDGLIKLSLRSKGDFEVDKIAKKYFNGGGHNNAAGGISNTTLLETIKKVELITNKYKNEIKKT
tara:strand:- start:9064 stop:10083 length:1020 start_codon:yes stop_codon:yes gene_type:complete